MSTNKLKAKFGAQLNYDTSAGDGNYQDFDAGFVDTPSLVIFDNQSNVNVTISDDGINDAKTFVASEALVLDLRANKGFPSEDLTFEKGKIFKAKSAAGSGNFTISYIYAV